MNLRGGDMMIAIWAIKKKFLIDGSFYVDF